MKRCRKWISKQGDKVFLQGQIPDDMKKIKSLSHMQTKLQYENYREKTHLL